MCDRRGGEQVQLICDSVNDEIEGIEAPLPPQDMVNLRLPLSDDHLEAVHQVAPRSAGVQ